MIRTVSSGRFAVPADFRVNPASSQAQSDVAFASLGSNGFIATWFDNSGIYRVFAQRFDLNGRKVGAELTIGAGSQPSVAVQGDGGFVVTWTAEAAYPEVFDIRGQVYDSAGAKVGGEFTANTATLGFQTESVVTPLAGGGFAVTWLHAEDTGFDHVRGQVFSAAGLKIGGEIVATDGRPGDKVSTDVVGLAGGGFVISWFEFNGDPADPSGNSVGDSRAQVFDSSGNKLGAAFTLNPPLPGTQGNASLAALPGGGFVAAWADDGGRFSGGAANGNQGVWIQLFDASGAKTGAAVHNDSGPERVGTPSIAVTPTGFLVTWREYALYEEAATQIQVQAFDFAGAKIGETFPVDGAAAAEEVQPDAIGLANGAVVIGWTNRAAPQFNDEDVRARILFPAQHGTEGNDALGGTANRDFFLGHGGSDTISGGGEDDMIDGGEGNDLLNGGAGDDVLDGGGGADILYLYDGGNDVADGGAGNDTFFFIGSLTSGDVVNGGDGTDTLVLQGAYGALTLTSNITQIENISILGGGNTNFGEPGTNRYDYVIRTNDSNIAAGVQARINAAALLAGEDFTFNGSAETNASFVVYGGKGVDTLTGGHGNDIFIYAEDRFAPGDTVNGGPNGYDGIFFRGNYTIDFNAPGYFGLMTSIENMTLMSITDERYSRGGDPAGFDYNITLADNQLLAGIELTVSGVFLMAGETMILDGSQELDGRFRLFGGKSDDTLKGGAQNDLLLGNLGADQLTGGGGVDTFRFDTTADSNAATRDHILDFTPGTDKIDLSRIDASTLAGGDQAFSWIGSGAFTGSAGQLRAFQQGGEWILQGDVNGDSVADLVIALTLQGPTPLGAGDFLL